MEMLQLINPRTKRNEQTGKKREPDKNKRRQYFKRYHLPHIGYFFIVDTLPIISGKFCSLFLGIYTSLIPFDNSNSVNPRCLVNRLILTNIQFVICGSSMKANVSTNFGSISDLGIWTLIESYKRGWKNNNMTNSITLGMVVSERTITTRGVIANLFHSYSHMQKTRISRAQILTNERKSYFLFFLLSAERGDGG